LPLSAGVVLLLSLSGASRYPLAIEIIGWVSIIAAMFLSIIGRDNFKRLMSWALSLKSRLVMLVAS